MSEERAPYGEAEVERKELAEYERAAKYVDGLTFGFNYGERVRVIEMVERVMREAEARGRAEGMREGIGIARKVQAYCESTEIAMDWEKQEQYGLGQAAKDIGDAIEALVGVQTDNQSPNADAPPPPTP